MCAAQSMVNYLTVYLVLSFLSSPRGVGLSDHTSAIFSAPPAPTCFGLPELGTIYHRAQLAYYSSLPAFRRAVAVFHYLYLQQNLVQSVSLKTFILGCNGVAFYPIYLFTCFAGIRYPFQDGIYPFCSIKDVNNDNNYNNKSCLGPIGPLSILFARIYLRHVLSVHTKTQIIKIIVPTFTSSSFSATIATRTLREKEQVCPKCHNLLAFVISPCN